MLEHSFCAGCGESHRGSGEGGPWWRERTRGRRHVNVLWRGGNGVEWGDAGVLYPARILPASYDLRNILNQGTLRPVLPVSGHPQPIVRAKQLFAAFNGAQEGPCTCHWQRRLLAAGRALGRCTSWKGPTVTNSHSPHT
jgi:hypothetical protein